MTQQKIPVWYEHGLRFQCTECGKCCSGSPGAVWISEDEINTASQFLGISRSEFQKRYLRTFHGRQALVEQKPMPHAPNDYACVFLKGKLCQIYPCRPKQCKTYPWWPEHLSSPEQWKLVANECEGVSDQAPVVPLEEIEKALS